MTLLLATDQVALYPAGNAPDSHGWEQPGTTPAWTGTGNLQAQAGRSDSRAADGGGHGPYDPRTGAAALLLLPPDAPVADGMTALVRGEPYALSQVRLITDPTGTGGLDCWAATATGTSTWAVA